MKLAITLLSLVVMLCMSCPADASLGKEVGLSLVLNPNITNIVTNNYTTYNYTSYGGLTPVAPWLYNATGSLHYNYSRLVQEFYNKTDTDALLNLQDECSEITGCVVGAITSSYNSTYHGFWVANRTSTSNSSGYWDNLDSPLTAWTDTYNASYHGLWLSNRTSTCNSSSYWDSLDAPLSSWTDTYNATYAAKQTDIGADCGAGNYSYGVSDDGTLKCRADVIGGEGSSYNATYHGTWQDVFANRSAWFSTYNASYLTAESDPLWSGNATAALSTYNVSYHGLWSSNRTSTSNSSSYWDNIDAPPGSWTDTFNSSYHSTWQDVLVNRTAFLTSCYNSTYESTYNSTYAAKQNDIGSNCAADNYAYGVQDDGTMLCRADQVGGGGGAGDKWVDGGAFVYPNSTFADNVAVYGYVKAHDWTNVSITKSQVSDFGTYLTSESDPIWQSNWSGYNKTNWDKAFSYATNNSFVPSSGDYIRGNGNLWITEPSDANAFLVYDGGSDILLQASTSSNTLYTNKLYPNVDNTHSLGHPEYRWTDFFLTGKISDGTNNATAAQMSSAYSYVTNGSFIATLNSSVAAWANQTATDVQCGTSCISDAEVDDTITAGNVEGTDLGTLTNGYYCTYDSGSTEVDCNTQYTVATDTDCSSTQYLDGDGNCDTGYLDADGTDDDTPDSDAEVPNDITIASSTGVNSSVPMYTNKICLTGGTTTCDVFVNATGVYLNSSKKMMTWNATHLIIRNTGA